MSGRPWYVQGADVIHRLTVLGILGYSGYMMYGIGSALHHNYERKQRNVLLNKAEEVAEFQERVVDNEESPRQ